MIHPQALKPLKAKYLYSGILTESFLTATQIQGRIKLATSAETPDHPEGSQDPMTGLLLTRFPSNPLMIRVPFFLFNFNKRPRNKRAKGYYWGT